MKVINLKGTSEKTCSCASWLEHWETFSGQTASVCGVFGCNNTDLVGAHVRRVSTYDHGTYIYPLCNACNKTSGQLDVWDNYQLVSADPGETCEKP